MPARTGRAAKIDWGKLVDRKWAGDKPPELDKAHRPSDALRCGRGRDLGRLEPAGVMRSVTKRATARLSTAAQGHTRLGRVGGKRIAVLIDDRNFALDQQRTIGTYANSDRHETLLDDV